MKAKREILLILLAMTLLAALIGKWWHSVYQDEVASLKSETDVVFFKALQEAEKNLVLRKSKGPMEMISSSFTHKSDVPDGLHDSIKKEMVVIKMKIDSAGGSGDESFNIKELFGVTNAQNDSSTSISISFNSKRSVIEIGEDGAYTIDVDSARLKLIDLFSSGLEDSNLEGLNFRVLKSGMDSNFNAAFITQIGKVGNSFLDAGEFIAAVDYHPLMILKKMATELLFGLFLFLLVGGAFAFIYQSLQKEKQLAQLKDDFVSNMTHELKTPISVVNVAVEALSDFNVLKDKNKSKEYLSISKRELSKLDHLVDQILTINHDTQSVEDTNSEVNVGEELKAVLQEFEIYSDRISTELYDSEVKVKMAPIHFRSVLTGLIDNALKYGPEEGRVKIALSKKNEHVEIRISDEGNRILNDHAKRIFDKFYRIPNQDIHDVKGHGLGLYYAKKHITNAQGKIEIDTSSEKNTFVIILPLTQ